MTQEKETKKTLKEEIENILEHFWSAQTSYFSDEKYGFEECTNDIIKLIEKHGYRKTKVLSGFWSD